MNHRLNRKILISTLWCLFLFPNLLTGQIYRFINYGTDKNIPSGFVYTLNQDENGFLWVGTANGISKFDGFEFHPVVFPDSAAGRYPTTSLKDKSGTLWFGCNDGTVFYTRQGNLVSLGVSNNRAISTIIESPDGSVFILPQGGSAFSVNPARPENVNTLGVGQDLVIFSACFTPTGDILLGTQGNIILCRTAKDSLTVSKTFDGFDYSSIKAIQKIDLTDSYLIGTDGNGLFRLNLSENNVRIDHLPGYPEFEYLGVQSISSDSDGYLWISTIESGVLQIQFSSGKDNIESYRFFNESSGLPGNSVTLVLQDIERNYWIGLFGDGLSLLNSYAFSFYAPGRTPDENNIISVNKINNKYFLGTPTGFYFFDIVSNKAGTFTDLTSKTGRNEISSYHIDNKNNIWIGTKTGELYVRNSTGALSLFYRSAGEDFITDIKTDENHIWLGTLNGVVLLDRKTGITINIYNMDNGLPHNSINKLFITSKGLAAVATKTNRMYYIDPESGIIQGKATMSGTTMNEISSLYESKDGHLWAATKGNGVFEFYGDSVRSYSKADLLLSDYCYSIVGDSLNRIWIGHVKGFSRYSRDNGIMRTYGTDFARGGDCNPDGMYESPDGKIFIGTNQGVIVYDRLKDKKNLIPPFNNIVSVSINDVQFPLKPGYSLPYSKKYIVKVGYVGINFSDPEKVYYQTKLDNYDDDWTKVTTDREVPYSLSDGRYKFNVISVNESGLSQENPVTFEIFIKKPFWRMWWFILSAIAVISGIVVLIVREREKAQKKVQVYLEKELDARTSVVMKQKYELELQNIEITDSINYAKRIQTSILPDFQKLKDVFPDAFILFRPRDIVSGDFYWFDRLDVDRFILVCADSTGHGVPGAFMSMIGSTLLQDIITRQHIVKPSEILKMLDKQIFSTLNQNVELGVANDGMDMVVCEINTKSRHIRFASAMRPVIIVMGGESFYIKGNRSSVGGESVIEKYFDDQEYYLNEGDTVYLFSDGLPDQFGGTDGKKMKIARLKKLIEDVANLPLSGQKEVILKFFDEWKGGYDQVDDILLMGVRL
jgi:ligand-binding sensor domain-containing protein/serine phosphatase RsbU (regulator of sigma subunit)